MTNGNQKILNQGSVALWIAVILVIVGILVAGSISLFFFNSNRTKRIEDLLQQKQGDDKLKTGVLVDVKNRNNTSLSEFTVSSDDEHYAYTTGPTSMEFVLYAPPKSLFLDGRRVKTRVYFADLKFSPNGEHFAYANLTENILVLDGREIPNYSGHGFAFSPDNQQFAYIGGEEGTGKGLFIVLNDNKMSKEYPGIRRISFSPNSRYLLYEVITKLGASDAFGRFIVVLDTKENTEQIYQHNQFIDNISFSSNGEVAYTTKAADGKKEYLTRNNRKTDEVYDEIQSLTFSPDGSQLAYIAKENDNDWFIILNGKKIHGPFNMANEYRTRENHGVTKNNIIFSADSNEIHYSYVTPDAVVIDGQKFKIPDMTYVYFIKFSPDNKHSAYLIQESCKKGLNWCFSLIADGTIVNQYGDKFGSISFSHFSADGKYFIFYGQNRDEIWRIVEEIEH